VAPQAARFPTCSTGSSRSSQDSKHPGITNLTARILQDAGGLADGRVTVQNLAAPNDCEILDLTLGPLDLNLLGLVVHLDTVHLNITAVPGAGNMLGNLL
jgi:hypothetical protein